MSVSHDRANELINNFLLAVSNAFNDELYAMNEGLHENNVRIAGNELYVALIGAVSEGPVIEGDVVEGPTVQGEAA